MRGSRRIAAWAGVAVCLAASTLALDARAHGPTVKLSYSRVTPERLVIRAGQTVHFHNASRTARTFTLRAEDGSIESPPLPRGEGWHHTFEEPGTFVFTAVERERLRCTIVVAESE